MALKRSAKGALELPKTMKRPQELMRLPSILRIKTKTDNPKSIPELTSRLCFLISGNFKTQNSTQYLWLKNVLESRFDFKQETAGIEYKCFAEICYAIRAFLRIKKA